MSVLDLEPRGPLPTEIYWRRRGLAIGIAVVVIAIAAAIVFVFVSHTAGAKPAKPAAGATRGRTPSHEAEAEDCLLYTSPSPRDTR